MFLSRLFFHMIDYSCNKSLNVTFSLICRIQQNLKTINQSSIFYSDLLKLFLSRRIIHRPREVGRTWLWGKVEKKQKLKNLSSVFWNNLAFQGRIEKASLFEFHEIYGLSKTFDFDLRVVKWNESKPRIGRNGRIVVDDLFFAR